MTYALILAKGISKKRDLTLSKLIKLKDDKTFFSNTKTKIEQVFVSFGWPDIIILLKADNVELLKNSIIKLRAIVSKHGDNLETSTIICTTLAELESKNKKSENCMDLRANNDQCNLIYFSILFMLICLLILFSGIKS